MSYKQRITSSKEHLDAQLRGLAKRYGHHGASNLQECARQKLNCAITAEYAATLLQEAGFSLPKS